MRDTTTYKYIIKLYLIKFKSFNHCFTLQAYNFWTIGNNKLNASPPPLQTTKQWSCHVNFNIKCYRQITSYVEIFTVRLFSYFYHIVFWYQLIDGFFFFFGEGSYLIKNYYFLFKDKMSNSGVLEGHYVICWTWTTWHLVNFVVDLHVFVWKGILIRKSF